MNSFKLSVLAGKGDPLIDTGFEFLKDRLRRVGYESVLP